MKSKSYFNHHTQIGKIFAGITGIVFLFYMVSCSSESVSPSSAGLSPVTSLTLNGVTEDSIGLDWDLFTKEGVADHEIVYTVYGETNDGGSGNVFTKDPNTETVYTIGFSVDLGEGRSSTVLPVIGMRAVGIAVDNLVSDTPYRIVVEARDASGRSSRSELLAYTASALTDSDIRLEVATVFDSDKITVTWDPKGGAQSYLIQASDGENQFGGIASVDRVLAVVCPPGFLLCEREDQFAQEKEGKLEYVLQVNKREGRYKLTVVPFNFRHLRGLQAVDREGRVMSFTEGVRSRVEDERSILSLLLKDTLNDPDQIKEIQIKVSKAEAPTDLFLDSTGDTLLANWGHGTGAEYYYAILTGEGMDAVTNIIDRYEASGRFTGGGYVGFLGLTANTAYTVTVQSLTVTVSNSTTNVGGEVSATLSTKDAGTLSAPRRVIGEDLILTSEEAGKLGIDWSTEEANSVVGYNVFFWVGDTVPDSPQYVSGEGDTNLSFTVPPGRYSVRVDVLSTYPGHEVVTGVTNPIVVYGKPLAPQGLRVVFDRGVYTNIADKLYAIGYPLTYTEARTPTEAGGPIEDVAYHYRYRVGGGDWIGYSEVADETMVSLQVDDLSDADVVKAGYGKKYQVEVIASNAGGFVSDAGTWEFTYQSFPEPFIQRTHLEVETGDRSLTVTWRAPSTSEANGSDIFSYIVTLNRDPYELPEQSNSVSATERKMVFENLENNQPYYITVIPNSAVTGNILTALSMVTGYAIGEAIEQKSEEATILAAYTGEPLPYTPQGAPEAVMNLAVTADEDQVTVTWSEPSTGSPATGYVLEYLADMSATVTNIDVTGDVADAELSRLSWEGATSIDVMTNDSGSYSQVISNLNVLSATNVFRVKGIHVDTIGEEWLGEPHYYALGTEISKAPSPVKNLTLSGHAADGSFRVAWEQPDDPGQGRNKASAQLAGYRVSWGTNRAELEEVFEMTDPDILSYTITGLTPGTQYYVKVEAKNDNEEGNIYNVGYSRSTYTVKPPGRVAAISYSGHSMNSFKVSWDAVTDAGYGPEGAFASVGYHLEFRDQTGWHSVIRSNYSATEETFFDLTPGTAYRVRVTVTNDFPLSSEVREGGETWTPSLPGSVGGLVVSDPDYDEANHRGGFKVSWSAPQDTGRSSIGSDATITGYEVAYALVSGGVPGEYTEVDHGGTATEYDFTGLNPGREYAIRIRAKNAAGTGVGEYISGWTPSLPEAVAAESIELSLPTARTIRISWDAPEPGRAGGSSSNVITTLYRVEIAPAVDGDGYVLVQDNYSGNSIRATNLNNSTAYHARVTAKNTWGSAPASVSTSTGTTAEKDSTPPSVVRDLKVTSFSNSYVVLSWTAPIELGTTDGSTEASFSGYIVKYKKTDAINDGFIEIDKDSVGVRLQEALTGTTATVIGLNGVTSYTFLVAAINSANDVTRDEEAATVEETTSSAIAPPSPPSLSVSNYGRNMYLSWTVEHFGSNADGTPAGFASYLVEEEGESQWNPVTTLNVNTMRYIHQITITNYNITNAITHTYRVTVTSAATPPQTNISEDVSGVIAAPTRPDRVAALRVTQITPDSITVAWEHPENMGTDIGGVPAALWAYFFDYKESSSTNWIPRGVETTSYTATNLRSQTSYDFRIFTINDASQSGYRDNALPTTELLNVITRYVAVESVSLSPREITFYNLGDVSNLSYAILPDNVSDPRVSWSSDNPAVATVDDKGQVTAVALGSATITVTTEDGNKTDSMAIIVVDRPPPVPENLRKDLTCDKGAAIKLHWDITPGAVAYTLYRDGQEIGRNITNTYYTDTRLDSGTPYDYEVEACSTRGCSEKTAPLTVATADKGLNFERIITFSTIPKDLSSYDEMSRDVFSSYAPDTPIVVKYVKDGGAGDGSSFADAAGDPRVVVNGITDASATKVYVVLLEGGSYTPGTMSMKNHVAIVGGVDKCLDPSETVVALDGEGKRRVFNNNGLNKTAVLYGVTITKGIASNDNGDGGGMKNIASSPRLARVTFSGNSSRWYGGGMYNKDSSPILTNVVFSENSSDDGAGMFNESSHPTLTRVTFSKNKAGAGGGIHNNNSHPVLTDVIFSENDANDGGGGGMNNWDSSPILIRVTFFKNTAYLDGGGMYNTRSSPTLIGATFFENAATRYGGAMYNDNDGRAGPTIINSIIWENTSGNKPTKQVYFVNGNSVSKSENLQIYNSIVERGAGDLESGKTYTIVNHGGFASDTEPESGSSDDQLDPVVITFSDIINADPGLVALTGNIGGATHTISPESPAVDKGLYVKRKDSTFYYSASGEDNTWYTDPGLSSETKATLPSDAEEITAVDATGHIRTDSPDLGVYEAR